MDGLTTSSTDARPQSQSPSLLCALRLSASSSPIFLIHPLGAHRGLRLSASLPTAATPAILQSSFLFSLFSPGVYTLVVNLVIQFLALS